jgi:hypothetical protein
MPFRGTMSHVPRPLNCSPLFEAVEDNVRPSTARAQRARVADAERVGIRVPHFTIQLTARHAQEQ